MGGGGGGLSPKLRKCFSVFCNLFPSQGHFQKLELILEHEDFPHFSEIEFEMSEHWDTSKSLSLIYIENIYIQHFAAFIKSIL